MNNSIFNKLLDKPLGKLVFSYCYKSKRNDDCFVIYKENNDYIVEQIDDDKNLPISTLGVIYDGIFLPYDETNEIQ